MTEANAETLRSQKLASLGLSYPLWLFDVDQGPWPRKTASIPSDSKGAKIIGWYKWPWEYGTDLRKIDDILPAGVVDTRFREITYPAQIILSMLRFDWRFPADTFRVLYEAGRGDDVSAKGHENEQIASRDFSDWLHENDSIGYIAPQRVIRIERRWDNIPFWDRVNGIDLLDRVGKQGFEAYGVVILVQDDADLLSYSGAYKNDPGDKIRKAEFEPEDSFGEPIKGIVWPVRTHEDRGLFMKGGPDSEHNKKVLHGTLLENAPWSDVENYVQGNRGSALT